MSVERPGINEEEAAKFNASRQKTAELALELNIAQEKLRGYLPPGEGEEEGLGLLDTLHEEAIREDLRIQDEKEKTALEAEIVAIREKIRNIK